MNAHCTPEAGPNIFDGDAVSRHDREFLASLGDHPLTRHPLYGVPCPPQPDFDPLRPEEDKDAVQKAVFATAVDWLLVNYAYREGAFMGKGGVISGHKSLPFISKQDQHRTKIAPGESSRNLQPAKAEQCEQRAKKMRNQEDRQWQRYLARTYRPPCRLVRVYFVWLLHQPTSRLEELMQNHHYTN